MTDPNRARVEAAAPCPFCGCKADFGNFYGPADAIPAQADAQRIERAERALHRAGWTYTEGAQEWRPPLGPNPSPLLDRIAELQAENHRLKSACAAVRKSIERFPGSVHDQAMAKIDKALGDRPLIYLDKDEARATAAEAEVVRLREALAFYANRDSYRNRSLEEQRELNGGADPVSARRGGDLWVEAPPGRALSDIQNDRYGSRARAALERKEADRKLLADHPDTLDRKEGL